MIEIRFSAPYDLDISGTADELEIIRQQILQLVQTADREIIFEADSTINPNPYEGALRRLVISKGECTTIVSLKNEDEVCIEGSPDNLEVLASFFAFDLNAEKGDHSHYEHHEGSECIDPDSIPLVISVK